MKATIIPKFFLLFLTISIISCSRTEDNVPLEEPISELAVDFLRETYIVNQSIEFGVLSIDGTDLTAISTFYINDQEIDGNTFTSSMEGEFRMKASYTNENNVVITTPEQTFDIIIPKRKILIEDYTGTWCGWCPTIQGAIDEVGRQTEDVVVVAIHEEANNIPDPLHFPQIQILKSQFGIVGFPAGRINRNEVWNTPYLTTQVTNAAGQPTDVAIAINSTLDNNSLNVDVEVAFGNGSNNGDKIVVYLLENGVISDQYNYQDSNTTSPFYNRGNPIIGFEHNHGLRHSFTNLLGNPIPEVEDEYRYSSSYTVPTSYNASNLEIVAILVDENNQALNVQKAAVNNFKDFE